MPSRPLILVADDELALQKLVVRRAEKHGFSVLCATTGSDLLRLAPEKVPDLILLDLRIGDEKGEDLMVRLKADSRTAGIPVIMWSGSDVEAGRALALEFGAVDFFEKTELKGLMSRIAEVLDNNAS